MLIERILVPTALDDSSAGALQWARELAALFRADLHILHVVPDAAHEPWAPQVVGIELDDLTAAWRCDAAERVRQCAHACRLGPPNVMAAVRQGVTADAILAYAAEQRIDLIVLGASASGPIARAIRGSTAERVTRQARCPVVSIPSCRAAASTVPAMASSRSAS